VNLLGEIIQTNFDFFKRRINKFDIQI
jgi:hypothetical protein